MLVRKVGEARQVREEREESEKKKMRARKGAGVKNVRGE